VLRGSGYTVLDANSGKTAIEIARFHRNRIDLLLTDIVMPGMRGWELASRLSVLRPEMKVLYMSGHTDTDLLKEGALMSGDALLEKPFRPEVLLLKVHDMLSRTNSRQAKVG
jgi:DNA-binding response OmpR family regulator